MVDSAGTSIGTTKYYPFGGARMSTGAIPTDKKFTGQRLDSTGLYYYNARYYDPVIGRFISSDTVVPDPKNPQCLNRYSYCLNNPLRYVDPSGHYQYDWYSWLTSIAITSPNTTISWVLTGSIPVLVGDGKSYVGYSNILYENKETNDQICYSTVDDSLILVKGSVQLAMTRDEYNYMKNRLMYTDQDIIDITSTLFAAYGVQTDAYKIQQWIAMPNSNYKVTMDNSILPADYVFNPGNPDSVTWKTIGFTAKGPSNQGFVNPYSSYCALFVSNSTVMDYLSDLDTWKTW
jgi:RHS repeat-associated protein